MDHYAGWFHKTRLADGVMEPPMWYPPELPDDKETILILAGDLWMGTKWIEYAGYSWIMKVASRFKQVLVVLGNHDYWPQGDITILNGGDKCNAMLQDHGLYNVHVLDSSVFEIDDIVFVGATLWTDMKKYDPLVMHNMTNFMAYDGKSAYSTGDGGEWSRFTSQKWVMHHDRQRDYIKHVVKSNPDRRVVVITHHIPVLGLNDPRFNGDVSNAYYESDLSEFILDHTNITHWFCGHTHHASDTMIGDMRIYLNPVGYQGEHLEQQGLVKHEVIEIEPFKWDEK